MFRLLKKLKPIKKSVIAAMIFAVVSQLGSLVLPVMMSDIINNGIKNEDVNYVIRVGSLMMCVSAVAVFVAVLNSYFSSKTSANFGRILRREIFVKVESLAQNDIDIIGTPSLITRSINDVRVMQDFILQSLRMIISAPIMLVGGILMAFILNAKLATVIFAVIPVIALIAFFVVKNVIPLFRKRQKLVDSINSFIREKLNGIRVIRAFNKSEQEDEKFEGKNNDLSALTLRFQRIMAVLIPTCIVLIIIALDLLIMIAAKNLDSLDYIKDAEKLMSSIGDLQAFVIYMIMIVAAVTMAAAMFVIIPRAKISAARIIEVLDIEPSIVDCENPLEVQQDKKGTVEFRNVSFKYENSGDYILKNVSFTAKPGQVTAFIGGTGSGKSSIVNLIPRFYDVDEGQVLFDGVDVRQLRQKDLRSRIGMVFQKAHLFSGTIEENLRYACENATDERIRLALDISQSSEFVDKLEKGAKSFVSQNGTNLSGGQKQRLSIARALTREAEVYIFDDSFSALDFATDARLRKAIKENLSATVIIVAQRVGTILDADNIVVLDKGEVCGMGTHSELIETNEVYKEIYSSQITKGEE